MHTTLIVLRRKALVLQLRRVVLLQLYKKDPKTLLNDQNGSSKYDIFLSARACELHACMNDIVARHGCAARISYKVMQIPIPLSLSPLC